MTTKVQQAILALSGLPSDRQDELADLIINQAQPVIQWASASTLEE